MPDQDLYTENYWFLFQRVAVLVGVFPGDATATGEEE